MTDRGRVWRAYFETSARLQTRLDRELRDSTGLDLVDYNVLLALHEAPGHRLRMGELAEAMVFSPSRLTYQVTTMERRGLVRREPSLDDRRGLSAVLTEAGAAAFATARRQHRRSVRTLFMDHVTDEEAAVLERVFTDVGVKLTGRQPGPAPC